MTIIQPIKRTYSKSSFRNLRFCNVRLENCLYHIEARRNIGRSFASRAFVSNTMSETVHPLIRVNYTAGGQNKAATS